MQKPVKVLILIDHLGGGGAQEFLFQLCQRMSSSKAEISVCALRYSGIYKEKFEQIGVMVHVLSTTGSAMHIPIVVFKLFRLLRTKRYDLLQTILQWSFVIGTPLAYLVKIPTVHSIMANRRQTQHWYFPLMSLYQRWVGIYVTPIPLELSEAGIKKDKIKLSEVTVDFSEELTIKHNAQINIKPFDLNKAYPVAISIGRLHPDKGHEYAISAWTHVLKKRPEAMLLIVGSGEDEKRLKHLINQFDLSKSIIFTGYRGDIQALFSRADMFLRTSVNEGVNLTTIRAMAAGLPTIGFQNQSSKEIIVHGRNGFLVPLGDEIGLAKAILKISSEKKLIDKFGQEGRKLVQHYYDIARVARCYEDFFLAIHEKKSLADLPDMSESINAFSDYFSESH